MSSPVGGRTEAKSGLAAEIESLKTPEVKDVAASPTVGAKAPSTTKLPLPDGKKTLILFLRHCGCPCKTSPQKAFPRRMNFHCKPLSSNSDRTGEREHSGPNPVSLSRRKPTNLPISQSQKRPSSRWQVCQTSTGTSTL